MNYIIMTKTLVSKAKQKRKKNKWLKHEKLVKKEINSWNKETETLKQTLIYCRSLWEFLKQFTATFFWNYNFQ